MKNNLKEFILEYKNLIISVVAILVVISIAFVIRTKQTEEIVPVTDNSSNAIQEEKEVVQTTTPLKNIVLSLNPDSKKIFEDRIIEAQEKIDSFTDKTQTQEKINYYFALAAAERGLGNYGTAEELFLKIIALEPKNADIHNAYASLLWMAKEYTHARTEINTAIALHPENANFWLSKIMYNIGAKNEVMEKIYENALSATKRDINIITSFASFEQKIGNKEKAIELWKEAQKLYPDRKGLYQTEIDALQ